MSHYEGAKPTEIFVGNRIRSNGIEDMKTAGITSARLGNTALDIEGKRLPKEYAPLFIDRSQDSIYDNYMMRKTFGDKWRRY